MKHILCNMLIIATTMTGLFYEPSIASAASPQELAVKEISNHFERVPTMKGEFVQFGPNGEQTGGTFFIQRPGRMRLNYEDPSPLMIVSNGKTLAVNNKKLKTRQFYPLKKTPLSLLLSNEIKLSDDAIRSVDASADVTRVVMGDKNVFGDSEITLLFDPNSYDLRQWTIKDSQGKETSVMIFNVEKNISIPGKMFSINKAKNKARTGDR